MTRDLKNVLRHSTVYGIGNILTKVGVFLMIPVYTRYLTPADYGTLELFYTSTTVLKTFLAAGIAHAALRFFFEYDDEHERRGVISTALLSSGALGVIGTAVFFLFSKELSMLLFGTGAHAGLFRLVAVTFFLELSMEISLAYVRAREYSVFFITVSTAQLVARVFFSVYLLVFKGMGIKGVLLGDLVGAGLAWLILTSVTVRFSGLRLDYPKFREMFSYSYPLVFGSVSTLVIGASDRYILNSFIGVGAIGLYALSYRFGSAIQAFYTEPFTKSYGPYRFSIMKRTDAGVFYSRILTYFLLGYLFLGLGVSMLSEEVIMIMAARPFWDAHLIVPLIVLGVAGGGAYYVIQIGIFIHKKTKYIPLILSFSAIINICLNLLLIPIAGSAGAAVALIATNLSTCVLAFIVSQRLYPVSYEFGRIARLFLVAGLVYGSSLLVDTGMIWLDMAVKAGLGLAFPCILYFIRFFHEDEVLLIKGQMANISDALLRRSSSTSTGA